ncbi:MAG: DUF1631 family protein [Burkholderiales bacterium]|nr:DUF1631 family protein [Burkholderiales bacterium]
MSQKPATPSPARHESPYRSTVQEAAAAGNLMAGRLVAAARQILQTRESACRDLRERDALAESARQLRQRESDLCKQYPQALLRVFANPDAGVQAANRPVAALQFEDLELMDDAQVLTSVAVARVQQTVLLACDAQLSELNALICSTLGMGTVRADRNPLRPECFIQALQEVLAQTGVSSAMQIDWLGAMSAALSTELKALYERLCEQLRAQGVVAAGYAVVQTPGGPGVGRGVAQFTTGAPPASASAMQPSVRVHSRDDGLLTLDRLRRLLAGELDGGEPLSRVDRFAQQFAQQFEGAAASQQAPVTDFDATVPAALEALKEMQQVDRVVQKLEQRRVAAAEMNLTSTNPIEVQRQAIRRSATSVAQALSLEVVSLMLDNMAHDPRLLDPVQQVIRSLEPALLRLSLADPRFFTEKQHPARQLLQELTHRSLAFDSVSNSGFDVFLKELEAAVAPLATTAIQDDEPFERVLLGLHETWAQAARQKERAREAAVFALQHAEARNLLAEKIARSIEEHPDAAQVPDVVVDFLCGPWAQVVAQARIKGGAGSEVADKYQALISALLWSAHPELARQNVAKLTRLVPRLLGTLREGLDSIQYPAVRTSVFFEALMGIHQRAFRAPAGGKASPLAGTADPAKAHEAAVATLRSSFVEAGEPWVAPEEAKSSNFIEIADLPGPNDSAAAMAPASASAAVQAVEPPAALDELPLGSWVELKSSGQWMRTQLTWASPHGTLFLFTNSVGATQSMTRRSCDKLMAAGHLRMVSGQPVVEVALDAVAKAALRNSLDTPP